MVDDLFGSGKADFTVGPDMTLSHVIAEAEDKTLEQVLGLLPAKEYLSKALKLPVPQTEDETEGAKDALGFQGYSSADARRFTEGTNDLFFRIVLEATPTTTLYEVSSLPADGPQYGGPLEPKLANAADTIYQLTTTVVGAGNNSEPKARGTRSVAQFSFRKLRSSRTRPRAKISRRSCIAAT